MKIGEELAVCTKAPAFAGGHDHNTDWGSTAVTVRENILRKFGG